MNIEEYTLRQIGLAFEYLHANNRNHTNDAQADIASSMIGKYCIVCTSNTGSHAGVLRERKGKEVVLRGSRKILLLRGAETLIQLARYGTSEPDKCKFSAPVESILLTDCVEIVPAYAEAIKSIQNIENYID